MASRLRLGGRRLGRRRRGKRFLVARARGENLEALFDAFPIVVGRRATSEERARFERYADLLLLWNRTHRLTGFRSRAAVARGLFLDSLLFRAVLPQGPLRIVDVGAGAGIPGLPLRIVEPMWSLTLIESKRKPVSFLRTLVRELALPDVVIHHGRAADAKIEVPDFAERFDVGVVRAVGNFSELVPVVMRYLKPGGLFVASGPPADPAREKPGSLPGSKWKIIKYEGLGLSRLFLLAAKGYTS